jgi:hypothetical protein
MQVLNQHNLPALPDGWHYESHCTESDVIHIVWPDHGGVSVSFEHRTFDSGFCTPHRLLYGSKRKSGRGWKVELINEAIEHLKRPWSES